MIGMRTMLQVADNSGAKRLQCILPRGGDVGSKAGLGQIVTASVKEAVPNSAISKGSVVKAVIVRMRKEHRRRDGLLVPRWIRLFEISAGSIPPSFREEPTSELKLMRDGIHLRPSFAPEDFGRPR